MPDRRTEDYATDEEVVQDAALLPLVAKRLAEVHAAGHILLRYGQPLPWRYASDQGSDVLRARRLDDLFPDRPLSGATK